MQEPEKVFMLMSKFELESVISKNLLSFAQRNELLESIFTVTLKLLAQNDHSLAIVLELYRIHLQTLVMSDFKEHHLSFLKFLLDVAFNITEDPCDIASSLWYDFLNMMSKGLIEFRPEMSIEKVSENVNILAGNLTKLTSQEVSE